jgi:hypothetical protein
VLRLESEEDNDEDPVNRGGTSLFCAPFIADVKLIIYLKKYEEKKFVTNSGKNLLNLSQLTAIEELHLCAQLHH